VDFKDSTAEARLRELLEETLLPPMTSVELVRTPQTDYQLRFGATAPHVAELFHENTKRTPYQPIDVAEAMRDLGEARRRYMTLPYRLLEEDLTPGKEHLLRVRHADLDAPLGALLTPLAHDEALGELAYSVDVMLVHRGALLRQIPMADFLWVEKHLSEHELERLRSCLLGVPSAALAQARDLLFFVGAPWRYMMFLGQRGYRRMMLDAGSLIERLRQRAAELGVEFQICLEFYDARIDGVLLIDGVERSALGVALLP
jgi:hypothetical protein